MSFGEMTGPEIKRAGPSPFNIILLLALDDPVHDLRIAEESNGQLAVQPAIDISG